MWSVCCPAALLLQAYQVLLLDLVADAPRRLAPLVAALEVWPEAVPAPEAETTSGDAIAPAAFHAALRALAAADASGEAAAEDEADGGWQLISPPPNPSRWPAAEAPLTAGAALQALGKGHWGWGGAPAPEPPAGGSAALVEALLSGLSED